MSTNDPNDEENGDWGDSVLIDISEADREEIPRLVQEEGAPLVAEIHLVHPDMLLAQTVATVPNVTIRPEYQTVVAPDSQTLFFTVTGGPMDEFERALVEDHTVDDPALVGDEDGYRVYRVSVKPDTVTVTPKTAELDIRMLDTRSSDGGWIVRLQIPSRDSLMAFRDFCRESGIRFHIRRLYTNGSEQEAFLGMTETQLATLRTAFDAGYFDVPRRISQNELAEMLGISTSGLSQRLRNALSQLIDRTIIDGE